MQLGRLTLSFALLLPAAALAQNAPFCVFSGAGAQCYYYNIQTCQNAARSIQGMCAPNQAQAQPRYSQQAQPAAAQPYQPIQRCDGYIVGNYCTPNPGDKFLEAYNRAKQQKMAQEEHEARMALLRAQTQSASIPQGAQQATPVYRCHSNGQPYLTDKDAGGCVFLGVMPTP